MTRDRATRRKNRANIIKRKTAILRCIGGDENVTAWTNGHSGRLSKNKIHCSCWMCRRKSFETPRMMDVRRKQQMMADVQEYYDRST